MPNLDDVILTGNDADKPPANPPGSLYFATDTAKVYRFNGSSWDDVTPGGGGGGTLGTQNGGFSYADIPPTSSDSMDDEFNGSALGSQWTKINDNGDTFTVHQGVISILNHTHSGDLWRFIQQPLPATAWQMTCKFYRPMTNGKNYQRTGLMIIDSAGKFIIMRQGNDGSGLVAKWNSPTSYNSGYNVIGSVQGANCNYYRITYDGTNLTFEASTNGISFVQIDQRSATNFLSDLSYVGLGQDNNNCGIDTITDFDWFRRTA